MLLVTLHLSTTRFRLSKMIEFDDIFIAFPFSYHSRACLDKTAESRANIVDVIVDETKLARERRKS